MSSDSIPQHAPQVSAGGVVFRRHGDGVEICLISKHAGRVWALPKGRLDEGESPEHAALREVLEETGHRAAIVEKIGDIEYEFHWKNNNTHYHKIVSFFLMRVVEENAQARDTEADVVEWVALREALERITHENELDILRKAQRALKEQT